MDITFYHKMAYLFQIGELSLKEIAGVMVTNMAVGVFDDYLDYEALVLSHLYDCLVYALVRDSVDVLLQSDIAQLLQCHTRTVRACQRRLEADGYLAGGFALGKDISGWIGYFAKALLDLRDDSVMMSETKMACININYKANVLAVKRQLRAKYYKGR